MISLLYSNAKLNNLIPCKLQPDMISQVRLGYTKHVVEIMAWYQITV